MNGKLCLSRRDLLAAAAGACLLPRTSFAATAETSSVVVELFTSQGCSLCPPADAFVAELSREKGILALTYHVDYWDYLGWQDTLGSSENSQRQYDYAKARGDMDVYTPQIIINGGTHFAGSRREEVTHALAAARGNPAIPVVLQATDAEVTVDVGAGSFGGKTTLWVLPVASAVTVKILKGEIAGQEVTYRNVVRKLIPAGMWKGEAKRFALPKDALMVGGADSCVALLQRGKVGEIIGSAGWGNLGS